jgi:hypothetical protein
LNRFFYFIVCVFLSLPLAYAQTCESLEKYYKNFDQDQRRQSLFSDRIKELLKQDDQNHAFYRAWPAFFHATLEKKLTHSNLLDFQGQIFGDTHSENFGVYAFKKRGHIFSVNDFDESAIGPMAADLIRLIGSAMIVIPNISDAEINQLINFYIQNDNIKLSNLADLIAQEADKDRGKIPKAVDKESKKFIPSKKKSIVVEKKCDMDEIKNLYQSINLKNPGKIHDCYKRLKISGGSGGLHSFYILREDGGKLRVDQIKELSEKVAPNAFRNNQSLRQANFQTENIFGNNSKKVIYNFEHQGSKYLYKSLKENFVALSPYSFELKSEKLTVLEDQFKILGRQHRLFNQGQLTSNFESFINSNRQVVLEVSKEMVEFFSEITRDCAQNFKL